MKIIFTKKQSSLLRKTNNRYEVLKTIGIIFIAFFFYQNGFCQSIPSYAFSASSSTYTALPAPSTISLTGNLDDAFANDQPINFPFVFNGTSYSTFNVSTNGVLTLGNATTAKFIANQTLASNNLFTPVRKPLLAPLWDDQIISQNSDIKYQLLGSSPNWIAVIQWSNITWDKQTTGNVLVNFQIRLHQSTNVIEFIYSATADPTSASASVGIAGAGTGSGNFLSVNQFSTAATVSSTTEFNMLGNSSYATGPKHPATGLTFTFTPRKSWVGAGAVGAGTDFNAAANWSPAGVPVASDDLYMGINTFSAATGGVNPFATLSANTTIKSLTIDFTGANAGTTIKKTFNLNTGSNNLNITNDLSMNNYSAGNGNGVGNPFTAGHTLNFNVQGGTTTVGKATISNNGSGSYYVSNIAVTSGATFADNGDYTATIFNGSTCPITLNNSGTTNINGTARSSSLIMSSGSVQFNVADAPASLNFNGDAYFDDNDISQSAKAVSLGSVSSLGSSGSITFTGANVRFGSHTDSKNASTTYGFVVFHRSGNQTISNFASLFYFPHVIIGDGTTHTSVGFLNSGNSIQIAAGSLSGNSDIALEVKNFSILDLGTKTLNISNGIKGIAKLDPNAQLKCGYNTGGLGNGSNFLNNFYSYNLDPTSIVNYYYAGDQTIADISPTNPGQYGSLVLTGGGVKTLAGSTTANGSVTIDPSTKLKLNDFIITANGGFPETSGNEGTIIANVIGDLNPKSGIITGGNASLKFDDTSHNYLKILTVNVGNTTLKNAVNIAAGIETVDGSGNGDYGTVTVNGTLSTNNVLTLKSNSGDVSARVATSSGTISDTVEVERFIPARRAWRWITVPFSSTNQTIHQSWQENATNPNVNTQNNPFPGYGTDITYDGNNGFDPNTTSNPSILYFDLANQDFTASGLASETPPVNSTLITAYPAYNLFVRGSRAVNLALGVGAPSDNTVLRSRGILSQGALTKFFTVPAAGDYVFIGNPYPSSINLSDILSAHVSQILSTKVWTWDASLAGTNNVGGYVEYSNGVKVPQNENEIPNDKVVIQPGEAFIVQTTGTSPAMGFDESNKINEQFNVFGRAQTNTPTPRAYINLRSAGADSTNLLDGVAAIFNPKFQQSIDTNDIEKFYNDGYAGSYPEAIALFRNDTNLSVEALPMPDSTSDTGYVRVRDTISIRLDNLQTKSYFLKILPEYIPSMFASAKLIDQYLNSTVNIPKNGITSYQFNVTASDTNTFKHRFVCLFGFNDAGGGSSSTSTDSVSFASTNSITPSKSLFISPNPASGNFVKIGFNSIDKGNYSIKVYGIGGVKLYETSVSHGGGSSQYPLRIQGLANGLYKIRVINKLSKESRTLSLLISK